jgi:hypothetical protein
MLWKIKLEPERVTDLVSRNCDGFDAVFLDFALVDINVILTFRALHGGAVTAPIRHYVNFDSEVSHFTLPI